MAITQQMLPGLGPIFPGGHLLCDPIRASQACPLRGIIQPCQFLHSLWLNEEARC